MGEFLPPARVGYHVLWATIMKKIPKAQSNTETVDRAISLVVADTKIDAALRRVGGKGRLVKVFR